MTDSDGAYVAVRAVTFQCGLGSNPGVDAMFSWFFAGFCVPSSANTSINFLNSSMRKAAVSICHFKFRFNLSIMEAISLSSLTDKDLRQETLHYIHAATIEIRLPKFSSASKRKLILKTSK